MALLSNVVDPNGQACSGVLPTPIQPAVGDAPTAGSRSRPSPLPSPRQGQAELIKDAPATGRTIAIVSNNSGAAISEYLRIHGLDQDVKLIEGRDSEDPDR
jgi:hypothetical protein